MGRRSSDPIGRLGISPLDRLPNNGPERGPRGLVRATRQYEVPNIVGMCG